MPWCQQLEGLGCPFRSGCTTGGQEGRANCWASGRWESREQLCREDRTECHVLCCLDGWFIAHTHAISMAGIQMYLWEALLWVTTSEPTSLARWGTSLAGSQQSIPSPPHLAAPQGSPHLDVERKAALAHGGLPRMRSSFGFSVVPEHRHSGQGVNQAAVLGKWGSSWQKKQAWLWCSGCDAWQRYLEGRHLCLPEQAGSAGAVVSYVTRGPGGCGAPPDTWPGFPVSTFKTGLGGSPKYTEGPRGV